VSVGPVAGLGRIVGRVAVAFVRRDVLGDPGVGVGEDEASARRTRAAEGQAGARDREARLLAGVGVDLLLVDMADTEEQVAAVGVHAPGDIDAGLGTVSLA